MSRFRVRPKQLSTAAVNCKGGHRHRRTVRNRRL